MRSKTSMILCIMALLALIGSSPTTAQQQGKPLDLPVALAAGPSTWLLGQPYGNTRGAYNFGSEWYSAGQRLHFGIDLSMPCSTPLVATADAMVVGVDDFAFGSRPHNLLLRHDEYGLVTLYGHLLERPPLVNGQFVQRGQAVGLSGDPDETCDSRPHLHLEVRSLDYRTAYNPVEYINAAWDSLANIGMFSSQSFQRDLDNPRRWMTLYDQPPVAFGGAALNNYAAAYPSGEQPPTNPPLYRDLGELPEGATWSARRLGYEGCCFYPRWHPTDPTRLYAIDGSPGQRASLYEWVIGDKPTFDIIGQAPPLFPSPDGTYEVRRTDTAVSVRRVSTSEEWYVNTEGGAPALNTDNTHLMWIMRRAPSIPGGNPPPVEIWLSDLTTSNPTKIIEQEGGSAVWLDATRILVTSVDNLLSTLTVYSVADGSSYALGTWERLRGLSVSPGGGRLMFYLTYHANPDENGVYTIETTPGATAVKLPWFGAWRWRDANSVFYIPFDSTTNRQSLAYYHLVSGAHWLLIDPVAVNFTVANGDWSVSADGRRIVYLNADDLATWLLEQSDAA